MKRYLPGCTLVLALAAGVAGVAKAATITTAGTGPIALDTANGTPPSTLTLNAVTATGGSSFTQTLTFVSGYDGAGGALPPTTFSELFTDGTNSATAAFSGTFTVSPTTDPDTFEIDPASFMLSGTTYSFGGITFNDAPPFPGGTVTEDLNFTASTSAVAATPEPSSLALLGTGLLGIAGAARRRFLGA